MEPAGKTGPEGGAAAPSGPTIPDHPTALGSHQGAGAPSSSPLPTSDGGAPQHLFNAVPVRAIEDVMACRGEQIHRYGHTLEADRARELWSAREFSSHGQRSLLRAITAQLSSAIEYAAFGRARHDIVRRYLVKTAAMCLAAIDWIDAEDAENGKDTTP